jgi:MFS transporter, DHA1 family, inner membrane transport protein
MVAATPLTELPCRAIDRPATRLALILAASVTESLVNVLPSFVGALTDVLGLSAQRTGLLASADLAGIAVATAVAPWWLREVSWRRTALGSLSALLLLNLGCLGVTHFWPLLVLRMLAGLATGTAFAIALAGVLDTRNADRNTGLMVCMQVVVGAAGVYVLDAVPAEWRLNAVYLYIVAWLIPTIALGLHCFPDNPGDRPIEGALQWRKLAGPGTALILGTLLYWLMIGAVWGYLEGVAREAGLTLVQTGEALSMGLVVSLVGSFASAWIGVRFGRALPLIVSALFQIGSLYLLTRLSHYRSPVAAFYTINTVFQIFWSYVVTYFIIVFNDADRSGRFLAFYGTACHSALAVGPYVGALLILNGRHTPLMWFGMVTLSICYGCFLCAVWLTRARPQVSEVTAPA